MSALQHEPDTVRFRAQSDLAGVLRDRLAANMPSARIPKDDALREFYAEVGARVREKRLEKGWSPSRLGAEVGVEAASIKNYERGANTLANLTRLADALETTPRWLLHGDESVVDLLVSTADGVQEIARSQALIHGRLERLEARMSQPAGGRTRQV